jgi:aminoglycoside phosphotransferase (APT) family kinase protein
MSASPTLATNTLRVLRLACAEAGLDAADAEPIRLGENAIFRLPRGLVARIARTGQENAARNEITVARWMAVVGVPAVEAIDVAQPIVVEGRAVTFWREFFEQRHATIAEIAGALKQLHSRALPADLALPRLAPFVRLADRITEATVISDDDRDWLRLRLDQLRAAYDDLPAGLPSSVIHGDAWYGNVVSTEDDRVIFVDLERCSVGPPEWDLVSTAVRYSSFGTLDLAEYQEFATSYGYDVLDWPGFEVLRDIRELRVTCYAAQRATENSAYGEEAAKRIASVRGERGPRPWKDWNAIP